MKQNIIFVLLVGGLVASFFCLGCATFARRYYASESIIEPEKWLIYGNAYGYCGAGLLKKLTNHDIIFKINGLQMRDSNLLGRIFNVSTILEGDSCSMAQQEKHHGDRFEIFFGKEIRTDERGSTYLIPFKVPNDIDQIDVRVSIEFKKPHQVQKYTKDIVLSFKQRESHRWESPIKYFFGNFLAGAGN